MSSLRDQLSDVKTLMANLNARVDAIDGHVAQSPDRVGTSHAAPELKPTPLAQVPTEGAGTGIETPLPATDPEAGFVDDAAIRDFRKAITLYEARKFGDASLVFGSFLEKYADHPLAGSAQYYRGECAFQQRDYKGAEEEFRKVLTSYERSAHVSDTLRDLAAAEDALHKDSEAERHRQLLGALFPQSPAGGAATAAANGAGSGETATQEIKEGIAQARKEAAAQQAAANANGSVKETDTEVEEKSEEISPPISVPPPPTVPLKNKDVASSTQAVTSPPGLAPPPTPEQFSGSGAEGQ